MKVATMSNDPITEQSASEQQIRIRIPKSLHQVPVISQLVSEHRLTVNIASAVLGANANGDGWFHLRLQGAPADLKSAVDYLEEIGIEIWRDEDSGEMKITG
jgi:ABC-type methionine transport system ATPase subunit